MTDGAIGGHWVIATAARRRTAVAVSGFVPLAAAVAAVSWWGSTRSPTAAIAAVVVVIVVTVGYVIQGMTLARHGRSLGHLMTRTRVVKRTSGTPLTMTQLLRGTLPGRRRHRPGSGAGHGPVGVVTGIATFDLVRGDDPRALSRPAIRLPEVREEVRRAARQPSRQPTIDPSLGPEALTLRFDTGEVFELGRTVYVGRNPTVPVGDTRATALFVADLSRTISKTHARIDWDEDRLWIEDLDSANGVAFQARGGPRVPIPVGRRTPVPPGVAIWFGDRSAAASLPAPVLI